MLRFFQRNQKSKKSNEGAVKPPSSAKSPERDDSLFEDEAPPELAVTGEGPPEKRLEIAPEPPDEDLIRPVILPVGEEVLPFAAAVVDRLVGIATTAVDRECLKTLGQMIRREELEIPQFPPVVHELLALDSKSELENSDVADLIMRDQALVARVLQYANSPLNGFADKIQSLDHCVAMLGFQTVSSFAVAASLSQAVFRVPGFQQEVTELQEHGIAMAESTSRLCREFGTAPRGFGFLCGLFHDVGKVVAYRNLSALRTRTRGATPSPLLTRKLIGELHPLLGLCFAEMRNLPEGVRWAIGYHHAPSFVPIKHADIVALVAACELAYEEPEAHQALLDGSDPRLLDETFWGEELPDLQALLAVVLDSPVA